MTKCGRFRMWCPMPTPREVAEKIFMLRCQAYKDGDCNRQNGHGRCDECEVVQREAIASALAAREAAVWEEARSQHKECCGCPMTYP